MNALRFGLAALGLALVAPAASAQNYVTNAMNAAVRNLRSEGFTQSHLRTRGSLREGQTRTFTIRLDAGRTYHLGGVCDEDCRDLDISLHDNRGNLIDQDESDDDVPVVAVTPRNTGRFRVTVRMYACDQEPCEFGLMVFSQR